MIKQLEDEVELALLHPGDETFLVKKDLPSANSFTVHGKFDSIHEKDGERYIRFTDSLYLPVMFYIDLSTDEKVQDHIRRHSDPIYTRKESHDIKLDDFPGKMAIYLLRTT